MKNKKITARAKKIRIIKKISSRRKKIIASQLHNNGPVTIVESVGGNVETNN